MSLHTPFDANRYAEEFHREGYFIREGVLADVEVERLRSAVAEIPNGEEVRRKRACTVCGTFWRSVPQSRDSRGRRTFVNW
jgi:hypothetical protein